MPSRRLYPTMKGDPGFSFGPGFIEARPEVSALLMQAIAEWSEVELQRSFLLVTLLDYSEPALEMYLALTSAVNKAAALDAIVRRKVSSEEHSLFKQIGKLASPIEKERNVFAHWIWGVSDAISDGLVCMHPAHRVRYAMHSRISLAKMQNPGPLDKREVFLVKTPDVQRVIQATRRVHGLLYSFVGLCGMPQGPERDARRLQLSTDLGSVEPDRPTTA